MIGSYELDTVVVGDCLDVMKQMPDECVDLVLTDPPYNASQNSIMIKGIGGADYSTIHESWDDAFDPLSVWPELLRVSRQGVVFCSYHLLDAWLSIIKRDCVFRQIIHLQKTNPIPSARKMWRFTTQYGLWWAKPKYTFNKISAGRDVLTYSAGHTGIRWHPTSKPVGPMGTIIEVHSNEGDLVFDPFMGSGTTAVAARMLGRHFFGCDISEEYVAMAQERLQMVQVRLL